jgi:hypothetical protein
VLLKNFNLVNANAIQGIIWHRYHSGIQTNSTELKLAETFYKEFISPRDRKPGEEYELVKHWAQDLV